METYQLALLTAQTIGEHKRVVAGLLHHIAWLFRYPRDGGGGAALFALRAGGLYISV